jgi:hypothetical protein
MGCTTKHTETPKLGRLYIILLTLTMRHPK